MQQILDLSKKEYQTNLETNLETKFEEKERLLKQKEDELLKKEKELKDQATKLKREKTEFESSKTSTQDTNVAINFLATSEEINMPVPTRARVPKVGTKSKENTTITATEVDTRVTTVSNCSINERPETEPPVRFFSETINSEPGPYRKHPKTNDYIYSCNCFHCKWR